nr:unnamed protein product [Digitaria exilis]
MVGLAKKEWDLLLGLLICVRDPMPAINANKRTDTAERRKGGNVAYGYNRLQFSIELSRGEPHPTRTGAPPTTSQKAEEHKPGRNRSECRVRRSSANTTHIDRSPDVGLVLVLFHAIVQSKRLCSGLVYQRGEGHFRQPTGRPTKHGGPSGHRPPCHDRTSFC